MSDQSEAVKQVIEAYLKSEGHPLPVEVDGVELVDDEVTGEQFFEAVLCVPGEETDDVMETFNATAAPTFSAYARFVEEGFDYPMEVVLYGDLPDGSRLPLFSFRVAVTWVREHINGNYTLEQTIALLYETIESPESVKDAVGWLPEYDLDWRQIDPPDEIGAGVDYEYWTSGKVAYPGEE